MTKIIDLAQMRRDSDTAGAIVRAPSSIERAADKPIRVVVSTGDVDRYRSTINQDGWNLDAYRANPVVLWMHDYGTPSIARSGKIAVEDGRLVAEPVFPERGTYSLADTVHDLIRGGFINAASVGWSADEWTYDEEMGGIRFIKQTLMEWSFVTVPGNAGALVEARALGIDIEPMRAHAEAILKATGAKDAELVARAGEKPRLYVFARGDVRVEAPTAKRLARAVEALRLTIADGPGRIPTAEKPGGNEPAAPVDSTRADEPPAEDAADEPADACKCGREFGADDKFCAACGEKRAAPAAEPEPAATDVDAERVLAAIQRITT